MASSFGAGPGALLLLGAILVVALVLAVVALVVLVGDRFGESVPRVVRGLAVSLLGLVAVVTAYAVLALVDQAPLGIWLFVALVGLPLAGATARVRAAGAVWLDALGTAALAWSLPYAVSLGAVFGLLGRGGAPFAVAVATGGVVATAGAVLAADLLLDIVVRAGT